MRLILICLSLALISSCVHGPNLQEFETAHGPGGIATSLSISGDTRGVDGELLEVRDDGILIATPSQVLFVSYGRILSGRFASAPRLRIGAQRVPGPEKRKDLSLLSRFPQGLEADVLHGLLGAYDQTEVVEVK